MGCACIRCILGKLTIDPGSPKLFFGDVRAWECKGPGFRGLGDLLSEVPGA